MTNARELSRQDSFGDLRSLGVAEPPGEPDKDVRPDVNGRDALGDRQRLGDPCVGQEGNQLLTRTARESAEAAARELGEPAIATAFELSALYKRRAKKKTEEPQGGGGPQGG
ncbi:hypothetical protein [Polyangium jinanense]|uniref:Uncharacterized protein n=1 Tax=Polyangium jinanense TaxID=2829994 RepID=A0A9X3XD78_9BACT|nr:hypothetical protein [Polyangium jinanense]MDC3986523.1 hypothetical protein [Polyangium jinanense]